MNNKIKSESGRSMVEILGVLAIMGVLTIGGISGFRYAMDKYRANEIINGVKTRAFVASQQRMYGQVIDLSEFHPEGEFDKILSFEVEPDDNYHEDTNLFSIFVYDVPEDTCNTVLNLDWQLPEAIDVNNVPVTPETVCEEINEITFAFGSTENWQTEPNPELPDVCLGIYINEQCCPQARICEDESDNTFCCAEGRYCNNKMCYGYCDNNQVWNTTADMCCDNVEPDANNCITQYVDATLGICPTYQYECDETTEFCDKGQCCTNGTFWNEIAEKCCPTPEPDENNCLTEYVAATKDVCPTYINECDEDEKCDNGKCKKTSCPENASLEDEDCDCILNWKMIDGVCEDCYAPGVCMVCERINGQLVKSFKPEGTPCVTAGLQGKCHRYGQCKPIEGKACSSQGSCPAGEFCNYGGTYSNFDSGLTPNVCQKVNALTTTIDGKKYYHATLRDLRSWCRSADKEKNCTWGLLASAGAQDWCRSLGKRIITIQELEQTRETWVKKYGTLHAVWVWNGGNMRHSHLDNTVEYNDSGRQDGYAFAGIPICTDQ